MTTVNGWQRLASFLRRYPKLMIIPYHLYRWFQPKYSVGVVGILFNENSEVLLVEHVFHPNLPWGLPGGWIGRDEAPEEAVQRELSEELALTVSVERVILLEHTKSHHLDIAYLCTSNDSIGALSYELLQYGWYAMDALPHLHRFHYEAIQLAYQQKEQALWDA